MTEKPRKPSELAGVPNQLLGEIRKMIEEARAASRKRLPMRGLSRR